jgi:hypothetical protein
MRFGAILTSLVLSTTLVPLVPANGTVVTRSLPPAWVAFDRAWSTIEGYSATVSVFERKGVEVQHLAFEYSFRKPSSATVRVIEGPNAGVTLQWNGGDTMEAHRGSGFAALFKRTLSLHDPLATTIRGSSIDQLSFGAVLAHGEATLGDASQGVGAAIQGMETDAVSVVPTTPATDASLTLEIVYLSKETHLPVLVVGYEGPILVRSVEFSSVKLDR